ncbi:hypothetical protein [Streptomyces coeruleorubidus]|uniref:hypothetical protein n=1 Tax=Streptomyces coeruleorubidus TaxID=116188 RepID=UPI0033B974AA
MRRQGGLKGPRLGLQTVLCGATTVLPESILFVGAFIPTLTLLLAAGALARTGHISLLFVIAAAAGAVVAGDFLAHRTGRLLGDQRKQVSDTPPRLLSSAS